MIRLLKSEFMKLTTTRMTLILLISSLAITVMYVLLYALLAGFDTGQGMTLPPLTSETSVRLVYSSVGAAYVIVLVFGIIGFTSEVRHRTLTMTYLATSNRFSVIVAKFVTQFFWGVIFALINLAIGLPLAYFLVNRVDHFEVPMSDLFYLSIGTIFAFGLYAVFGVALGALIQNQIAAVVGALVWVLIIEAIFISLWPSIGKWLPAGAASGMLDARSLDGSQFLEPIQGGLLLLAYATFTMLIATLTTVKRDIS